MALEIQWPDWSSDECGCDVTFRQYENVVRPSQRVRIGKKKSALVPQQPKSIIHYENGRIEDVPLRHLTLPRLLRGAQNLEYWQGVDRDIRKAIADAEANLAAIEAGNPELPEDATLDEWRRFNEKELDDRQRELKRPMVVDTAGFHVRHGKKMLGTLVPCEKHAHIKCTNVTSNVVPVGGGTLVRYVFMGEDVVERGKRVLFRCVQQLGPDHTIEEALSLCPGPNYG